MIETNLLEEIGFTKGEIKVYFALLGLGEATIGAIAKKSGVTPAKTYPILEKLAKKGLTTSVIKSNTQHFQAFNPKRILNYIEEKRKKLKHEENEIKRLLPQLTARQVKEAKQSATVYESYRGLKTLYDEFIEELKNSKEEFIAFTLGHEYEDPSLMLFFEHYDLARKNLGIKTRLIGIEEQRRFFKKRLLESSAIEIRYLPYASVPQGVIIVGGRIATMMWKPEPVAFVIQSKLIAEAYRKFFWDLWKQAKK